MKKTISILLIAVLLCASALAAGSFNLGREISETYQDYPNSVAVLNNAAYILGNRYVYEWNEGDSALTAYALQKDTDETDVYRGFYSLFTWNGQLCALQTSAHSGEDRYHVMGLDVVGVSFDGEKAVMNTLLSVNTEDLVYSEDGYDYLCQINGTVCTGDNLCLNIYDSSYNPALYVVDLTDGSGSFTPVEHVENITAFGEGCVLVEYFDYDTQKLSFDIYDVENETVTSACEPLDAENCDARYGLAYDAENGRLYYLSEGFLKSADNFDFANSVDVAELSVGYYYNMSGLLMPGGYYVYSCYDGTFVRSTNPDDKLERYLNVRDFSYSEAVSRTYEGFNNTHADIASIINHDYQEDSRIIEDMMNRDSHTDIYIINSNSQAFSALYDRGYMLDLSGNETIREFVNDMYPALRDACMRDGEIITLPVQINGWTLCANTKSLEALGYTAEDIPAYWPDFLDFLNEIATKLPEDGSIRIFDAYMSQQDALSQLFYEIMSDYDLYLCMNSQEKGYDTPELNAALEKLQQLDFEAMGLHETVEDEEPADMVLALFQTGCGCTLGNFYDGATPLLLSFEADTEGSLPISMSAAFVNPFSENADAALDFLQEMIKNADNSLLYNVSDSLNEPLRHSSYEKNLEDMEESIEDLRASLETAEPVDVPVIEEQIAESEGYLEEYRQNVWEISPASIEWYRAHADRIAVSGYNYLNGESAGDVYDLYSQFLENRIDVKTLLKSIDQKVKMMAMEGN